LSVLLWIYYLATLALATYGLNALLYSILYLRGRPKPALPPPPLTEFPRVTVQLPIYNELYVVERLIDAVAHLDYPASRLQIQVLDDSDDQTTQIAQARVDHHRRRGIDIELRRRANRAGFKAGALTSALEFATGEFIAVFDADFVPPRAFLRQTIPYLLQDPRVGLAQARWGHLNPDYSPLTRAQALALDGHFVIEQGVRSGQGWFMNFNGTAGVWRRSCIEGAGGWHADTLSEDLDLSYRAQLDGWKFLYLNDVVAPAELPPQIHASKRQQFRWAKGSTQCLLKFATRLATARTPFVKRFEGLIHLSGYVMQTMMLLMLLTLVPLTLTRTQFPLILSYFSLASFGPPLLYTLSQRALYKDWRERLNYFPFLLLLGVGLAFNNALAVTEALLGRHSGFRRTPKYNLNDPRERWGEREYALGFGWESVGEIALTIYALIGMLGAWETGQYWVMPFLALYALGFGYVGALSLWHSRLRALARREVGEIKLGADNLSQVS
jgi:cellulose synthase/poly-beta-1,6-N-acetylglucosamine synthase-like glycosyltransferase